MEIYPLRLFFSILSYSTKVKFYLHVQDVMGLSRRIKSSSSFLYGVRTYHLSIQPRIRSALIPIINREQFPVMVQNAKRSQCFLYKKLKRVSVRISSPTLKILEPLMVQDMSDTLSLTLVGYSLSISWHVFFSVSLNFTIQD